MSSLPLAGNTIQCNFAMSTYNSKLNSWTTFTPATCSVNRSQTTSSSSTSTLPPITSTGIITSSLQETPSNDVSTVTEFSSTRITTTITGSLSTASQISNAPKETLGFELYGLAGLGWILYFSYKLIHR